MILEMTGKEFKQLINTHSKVVWKGRGIGIVLKDGEVVSTNGFIMIKTVLPKFTANFKILDMKAILTIARECSVYNKVVMTKKGDTITINATEPTKKAKFKFLTFTHKLPDNFDRILHYEGVINDLEAKNIIVTKLPSGFVTDDRYRLKLTVDNQFSVKRDYDVTYDKNDFDKTLGGVGAYARKGKSINGENLITEVKLNNRNQPIYQYGSFLKLFNKKQVEMAWSEPDAIMEVTILNKPNTKYYAVALSEGAE